MLTGFDLDPEPAVQLDTDVVQLDTGTEGPDGTVDTDRAGPLMPGSIVLDAAELLLVLGQEREDAGSGISNINTQNGGFTAQPSPAVDAQAALDTLDGFGPCEALPGPPVILARCPDRLVLAPESQEQSDSCQKYGDMSQRTDLRAICRL